MKETKKVPETIFAPIHKKIQPQNLFETPQVFETPQREKKDPEEVIASLDEISEAIFDSFFKKTIDLEI